MNKRTLVIKQNVDIELPNAMGDGETTGGISSSNSRYYLNKHYAASSFNVTRKVSSTTQTLPPTIIEQSIP